MEVRLNRLFRALGVAAIGSALAVPATAAEITVGLVTSMTGPGASIGIPYAKGAAPGLAYRDEVNGIKIKLIQLDDASDPSTGTRDARKLIEQDKVDVLMGAGSTPTSIAITAVCHELKVPCITLAPANVPRRTRLLDDLDPAAADADGRSRGRLHEGRGREDGWLYRLQRWLGRSGLWRAGKVRRSRRHQNPDQRALCARRHVRDRAGAPHRRGRSRTR